MSVFHAAYKTASEFSIREFKTCSQQHGRRHRDCTMLTYPTFYIQWILYAIIKKFIHSGENYGPKFQNRLVLYFRIGLLACSSGFKLRRCYRTRKMDRASTTSALTLRHVMNILYKPNWACLFSAQPITARRLFAFHSSIAACALLSHTRCSSGRQVTFF